jgi:hypothetical protein
MNKHTARKRPPRCLYRTSAGRRCRLSVSSPDSEFCRLHATLSDGTQADLSAALTGGLDEFSSPTAINEFLSRLLLLLSENRISPRRAAVLAYITNQILRTIAVMEAAAIAQARQKPPVKVIWDLPCPPHESREPEPEPQQNQPPGLFAQGC